MSKKTEWEILARPYEPEKETNKEYWDRTELLRDKPVGEKPLGLVDVSRWNSMRKEERKEVPSPNKWRIRWFVAQGWLVVLGSIVIIIIATQLPK